VGIILVLIVTRVCVSLLAADQGSFLPSKDCSEVLAIWPKNLSNGGYFSFFVTVRKYSRKSTQKRKHLLWLITSEVQPELPDTIAINLR
jgi:hypothetical protein